MTMGDLIPSMGPIQVSPEIIKFILLVSFVVHLLFMNSMIGVGVIALVDHIRNRKSAIIAKDMSKTLPFLIAFTVNTGVAPLLFLQVIYGHFYYTSSILMAFYWLPVFIIIIMAYYSAYAYDFRFEKNTLIALIWIFISVLSLLGIGYLFTNNMTSMIMPSHWISYFNNPNGTLLNTDSVIIPRYAHMMVGAISMGGLFLALYYMIKDKNTKRHYTQIKHGMKWFTYGTSLQIVIGICYLAWLPKHVFLIFMGGNFIATTFLILGIAGALLAVFFGSNMMVWSSACVSFVNIVLMVLIRDSMRTGYLEQYFRLDDLSITPNYSVFAIFVICAIVGFSLMAYILKLAIACKKT